MREKKLFLRVASFMLALVMVFSVLVVVPERTEAADFDYNFNKTSTVKITDTTDWYTTQSFTWIKYKAPADGYLQVKASYASGAYTYSHGGWQLYASDKKTALSGDEGYSTNYDESYMYTNNYGMKKGKTYFLRVQSQGGIKISSKFYKVSDKSKSSKSKAASIGKGKTVKGIVPAGDKNADWYKFKVTKTQFLRIFWSAKTNEAIDFTVYEGSRSLGTVGSDYKSSAVRSTNVVNPSGVKIKVQPSTYYVKVERHTKTSSGYYTFKWN